MIVKILKKELTFMQKIGKNNGINNYQTQESSTAFGLVQVNRRQSTLEDELTKIEGILEAHYVATDNLYVVKLAASNNSGLGDLVHQVEMLEGVVSTRTLVVLNTLKNAPLD